MKNLFFTKSLLALLLLISCNGETILPANKEGVNWEINSDKYLTATTQATGDPFVIKKVVLTDSLLKVTVQYGGGCEKHDFKLIWDGKIDSSTIIAQVTFALIHDSHNDSCEAFLTEEIAFNLFDVMEGNRPIEGYEVQVVNASTNESTPAFPESEYCGWAVEVVEVICGDGVWNNLWLQTLRTDQAGGVRSFLLQPARASTGIDLPESPEIGTKYYIGAKIIDNYESNPDMAICQAYPGDHYTIEITCLQPYE